MENETIKQYVSNINGYYIKDAEARENKADKGTKLSEYGITDAYTKSEVDEQNDALNQSILDTNSAIQNINLTSYEKISNASITTNRGSIDNNYTSLTVAKNNDGSLCKIYGRVKLLFNNANGNYHITFPTSLRPQQEITISTSVLSRVIIGSSSIQQVFITSLTIGTNGVVTSGDIHVYEGVIQGDLFFMPFLLFVKDFGDVPTPEEPVEPEQSEQSEG